MGKHEIWLVFKNGKGVKCSEHKRKLDADNDCSMLIDQASITKQSSVNYRVYAAGEAEKAGLF